MTLFNTINEVQSELKYMTVANVKLEVERYQGADNAPTLIFLHEGLGCVRMWRNFPKKLAHLTGCPALVYSRQGYGRSDPCALPRPHRYMHDEALETLPQLLVAAGIEDYILIGHSDGGSIALIYAGEKERPGLLGIITMAPHVFCEDICTASLIPSKDAFLNGKLRSSLEKYHYENTDCAFWGWHDAWQEFGPSKWNIEEYLPNIKVPQLVLQGENDRYGTAEQVQSIARQVGGPLALHMLATCGHSPHIDQELQCLKLMKNFILPLSPLRA